jgi:hypothetical protein
MSRPSEGSPLLRYVLPALSFLGLVLGIASTLGGKGMAARLGLIGPALRDPIGPLLLSLICAVAFVAWSAEPGRTVRRPVVIVWLSIIAGALLIAIPSVFFDWAAGDVYPVGDSAMLEIYTTHAVSGIWTLGPYSQFGWHHPGPLYFYLLAPLYVLSGEKTIALHVSAFAINLLSLCAIAYVLIRYAAPGVACAAAVALSLYVFRLQPIIASFWNPHIVILPAATFLLLCAAVAAGRGGALPPVVLVGSFLVQTHVSLAPYVLLLASGALAAAAWWPARTQTHQRSLGWWIHASTWLLVLLWLFPIAQQVSHTPGNLTRLMQFFGEPSPGQELRTALFVWGDTISALFQRHLEVPAGSPLAIPAQSITITSVCAIVQVLLLSAACWDAQRRRDRFDAALTAAGLLASVTALWSITRVKSLIGEYMIFWLSAIGTLNWAMIAGLALTRVVGVRLRALQQWAVLGASALMVSGFVHLGSDELKRARRHGLRPPRDSARVVKLASQAVLDDMRRHHVQRPLFQMGTRDWGAAAGVLLQVYKRGVPPAVDASLVAFFGEPLAPNGREDRVIVIADATTHRALIGRPGYELVADVEGMYIHASPIMKHQSTESRTP